MSRDAIERLIPHREPFLFVDSVELRGRREASGIASWPHDSRFFDGHFPGNPIVPGVYLIEAAAQVTAVLLGAEIEKPDAPDLEGRLGVLAGVRRFVIRKLVRPDERIRIDISVSPVPPTFMVAEAKGYADGEPVFGAQLIVGAI